LQPIEVRRGVPVVPITEDVTLRWLRPQERCPRATEVGAFASLARIRQRGIPAMAKAKPDSPAAQAQVRARAVGSYLANMRVGQRCHPTGRLSASARCPASVIIILTTVIRRVPARVVPGWIVASPSRESRSSNAFVKPWANISATVRPCSESASSRSARRCSMLVIMRALA
jgi:hypothetical protein